MTVKSKRGRRRYVAFRVSPQLTASSLAAGLPRQFRVIQCAEGMAVVRCEPDTREGCIAAVLRADPGAEAVRTSGTLRTLRERYSVLKRNAPPKPARKGTGPVRKK